MRPEASGVRTKDSIPMEGVKSIPRRTTYHGTVGGRDTPVVFEDHLQQTLQDPLSRLLRHAGG